MCILMPIAKVIELYLITKLPLARLIPDHSGSLRIIPDHSGSGNFVDFHIIPPKKQAILVYKNSNFLLNLDFWVSLII